jgi:NAD-dependent dihydropyrimidine dehydrogenase PreA subunit
MTIHNPVIRHTETKYIRLNSHLCKACWKCVETCPNGVIGKVKLLIHKHSRIDHAEKCRGCKKCVNACEQKAITYLGTSPN